MFQGHDVVEGIAEVELYVFEESELGIRDGDNLSSWEWVCYVIMVCFADIWDVCKVQGYARVCATQRYWIKECDPTSTVLFRP